MNYKRYIGYVSAQGGEVVPISLAHELECAHSVTEIRAAYTFDTIHCLRCGKQIGIY